MGVSLKRLSTATALYCDSCSPFRRCAKSRELLGLSDIS
jgi:hypothetical protein